MSRPPRRIAGRAKPAPQPRASRERQRQRLIDACISALHVHGPSNTTVEKVVAIARMSPGIVRFYFDSKAAMLVASLDYLAQEFEARLLVPVGELKATPVVALERLVELYLGVELATARKVSVWYSFWGEASSRQEYLDICGKRDERFEALCRELIGRLVAETGARHLDADAIALGLIGVLEMLWQGYAFQTESTIDRAEARRRCMAYLRSVFPTRFAAPTAALPAHELPRGAYRDRQLWAAERATLFAGSWQFVALESELPLAGSYLTLELPGCRVLVIRGPAGALRALHNTCPQRPHALLEARAGRDLPQLHCSVHNLRYDLDGRPLEGTPGGRLESLELATIGGFVCVRLPGEGRPAAPLPSPASLAGAAAIGFVAAEPARECAVAADWKLIVEGWLEQPGGRGEAGSTVEFAGDLPVPATFRERRYRTLAAAAGGTGWQRSVVHPNQLIDRRPGRLRILTALPAAPGRSVLRVVDYVLPPGARPNRALAYLAARLDRPRLEAELALAASIQEGLDADRPAGQTPGVIPAPLAGFRHMIARLLPGMPRPPGDPV